MYFIVAFGPKEKGEERLVERPDDGQLLRVPLDSVFLVHAVCHDEREADELKAELKRYLSLTDEEAAAYEVLREELYVSVCTIRRGLKKQFIVRNDVVRSDVIFEARKADVIRLSGSAPSYGEAVALGESKRAETVQMFLANAAEFGFPGATLQNFHPSLRRELNLDHHAPT